MLAVPTTDSVGNIIRDADGQTIPRRTTIYDAARQLFVKKPGDVNPIPTLCHQEHMSPVGVCRVCVVEILKEGKQDSRLVPACQHRIEPKMVVHTINSPDQEASQRVRKSVGMLLEMLSADHLPQPGSAVAPPATARPPNELETLVQRFVPQTPRFNPRTQSRGRDDSSLVIAVDHNACILCDRCSRACDEVKQNLVIGRTGKGYTTHIGFDLNSPMGQSSCVSCGECMISCPTDALTYRSQPPLPGVAGRGVSPISITELRELSPLFAGIPFKFLQWNAGSVVRRSLRKGDVLCKEGDYGSTAFILLSGLYGISIRSKMARVKNESETGFWGALGRIKTSLSRGPQSGEPIRNDGNSPLSPQNPSSVRTPEDLILGEMTCLSHYPRSATIVAVEDGEVLEIRRNVLTFLLRNPVSREILNRVYRDRALKTHLQNMNIFSHLDEPERDACVAFLRDKVELLRVEPGQVVFRQGELADHFYMVRLGFVKVTQDFDGGQRVLNYLGPGKYFGEIGLVSDLSDLFGDVLPPEFVGLRQATCGALDDVELVRIRGEHFRYLVQKYPRLRERLVQESLELLKRDQEGKVKLGRPLEDFLDQGLFNAHRLLVLDLERCTRCDECTKACADTHGGVTRLIREGLRFDKFLIASSCRSCFDPYCLVGCPVDAIHRENTLEIRIKDHCIGCGLCAENCPYGNINMHGFPDVRDDPAKPGNKIAVTQQKATTCDLCRDVHGKEPSCVYACPHNAAFRMSGEQLMNIVSSKSHR